MLRATMIQRGAAGHVVSEVAIAEFDVIEARWVSSGTRLPGDFRTPREAEAFASGFNEGYAHAVSEAKKAKKGARR